MPVITLLMKEGALYFVYVGLHRSHQGLISLVSIIEVLNVISIVLICHLVCHIQFWKTRGQIRSTFVGKRRITWIFWVVSQHNFCESSTHFSAFHRVGSLLMCRFILDLRQVGSSHVNPNLLSSYNELDMRGMSIELDVVSPSGSFVRMWGEGSSDYHHTMDVARGW